MFYSEIILSKCFILWSMNALGWMWVTNPACIPVSSTELDEQPKKSKEAWSKVLLQFELDGICWNVRLPFLVVLGVPVSASIFSFRDIFSFLHRQPVFDPLYSLIRTKRRFTILRKTTLAARLSTTSPIHRYISMCIANYAFPCHTFLLKCLLLFLICGGIHSCVRFALWLVSVHLFQQVYSVQER